MAALTGRFGGAELIFIHPRRDRPAIRVIARAQRGSRARLSIRPPLVLHENDGRPTAVAEALSDGRASLFGD
jgi:tRNA1(Val) A37 N6-methylase TrmN6